MTDASGTVVWSADYKPFGEATVAVSTITNNLRFPGQYFDAETGLHYNYFRDYNPLIGMYVEADPIGTNPNLIEVTRDIFTASPDYFHSFVYVGNRPVLLIDPQGLLPQKKFCNKCDWKEKAALLKRLNDVLTRLASGNFRGDPNKSLGQTNCAPWGAGFIVKQDIPSNCVYNCVWEHENKHYQDCLQLPRLDRSNANVKERPGWEAEMTCLHNSLSL